MSLKILHTSDWHLGKTFRSTTFDLLDVQKKILDELVSIVRDQRPNIVLVAGDIFDTYNPSFEAERLFYQTITKISDANSLVIAIAGNHDSPDKLKISRPLIYGRHPIIISGTPSDYKEDYTFENDLFKLGVEEDFLRLKIKDTNTILSIKVIPYPSEVRMGLSGGEFKDNLHEYISREPQFSCDYFIFTSHLFVSGATKSGSERSLQIGSIDSIPAEVLPKNAHYTALGHLHRFQRICNAVYSGSIYPFDVGEIDDKKGVCIWQGGETDFLHFRDIPKIKSLEFDSLEEAIKFNMPTNSDLYYLFIRSKESYGHEKINRLIKNYGDKLVGWQPENTKFETAKKTLDINSLSEEELFREFFKFKNNNIEPDNDLVSLFTSCLEEATNAAN